MIIPLKVYYFAEGLRAMASFFVKSEGIGLKIGIINFMVDSGSPETLIGLDDVERLRISMNKINKLESRKFPLSYGGANIKMKILNGVKFKTNNFETVQSVLVPTERPMRDESKNGGKSSQPSILGVDFLEKNNLKFVFNPSKREAFLEKEKV